MIRWLHNTSRALLRLNSFLEENTALAAERDKVLVDLAAARAQALDDRMAALSTAATARVTALLVTIEAVSLIREAQQHAAGCRAIVLQLIEPGRVEQCTKVRLRSEDEAKEFAARMLADTGVETEPHRCRYCPRQPVSLETFWHITHVDPAKRGQKGRDEPIRSPRLLDHVTPADVAAMRARARAHEEAS